jgi:HlyD family secretion protein
VNTREKFARFWALRWRILAGCAVLVGAGYLLFRVAVGPMVEVARVARREVVQSVVASGRVATPYRVDIGSQVVGTVAQVPVAEGQTGTAGQTLVALEASEARAGVKLAQVAVAQAEARLRQLRELQLPVASQALRQAQANLTDARAQFERNKILYKGGFISSSVLDESQRNLDVTEAQVDSARKQVETAQPTGSDTAMALRALDQARASLQEAQAKLAYTVIRAPSAGTLIARDVERGDVVQPGKVLMVLPPAGETQLVLAIDERNLGKLKLGQKALASADAYATQQIAAELVYINHGVDAQRGVVEVTIRVPEPPEYLRQDMTVSVDIEVERHPNALALPVEAVHDATGPSPWVLKVNNGRASAQRVKLGLRGAGAVEIREGLEAGDLVAAAGNSKVKAGQRLHPLTNE